MRVIWALAIKDLRLLLADKVGFFFVFFYPLLFATFFGFVIGGMYRGDGPEKAIEIVAVDEDGSDAAEAYLRDLHASDALTVYTAGTRDAGQRLVRTGKRAACVIIHEGFGAASERIFWGEPMKIDLIIDPSRPMERGVVEGLVRATAFERMKGLFTEPDAMKRNMRLARESLAEADVSDLSAGQVAILSTFLSAAEGFFDTFPFETAADGDDPNTTTQTAGGLGDWQPVAVTVQNVTRLEGGEVAGPRHSAFSIVFPQGIVWGVMACAASFAMTLVVERTRGTLPRLIVAPLLRWQILAGKGLACFLATAGVSLVLLLVARLVFGVVPDSLPLLLLAVLCISCAIVGVMMLFAVAGKTEAAVGGISWAVVVIMAMFGGGMIPLSQMGGWLERLSYGSVFRWAILALDGAIWRDFTLVQIIQPCAVLLLIGAVGFAIGASLFRFGEQR